MKYQIAIPSYNRATILKKKTLPLLKRFNINNSDIYIFVETEEMKKEYQASGITTYRYVVTNTKGICEKRNFLETYYREQVGIDGYISIDDDIQDIFELSEDSKTVETSVNSLTEHLRKPMRGVIAYGESVHYTIPFLCLTRNLLI